MQVSADGMTLEEVEAAHEGFAGLTAFYHKELEPYLVEQEQLRSAAHAKLKKATFISVPLGAVALLGIWLLGGFASGWVGYAAAVVIVIAVLGVLAYHTASVSEVTDRVKAEVLHRLCGFLGFSFNPDPSASQLGRFRENRILPSYDRSSLEDEINGEHEGVRFTLCEAHLEDRRTRRNSNGRTETYYVTVFRGLLASFTFPKTFTSRTILTSDGGLIGNFFGGLGKGGERVRLEDPRFEKKFEVFSDDQVEARYLLTPTFMERVCDLADDIGGRLQLAFHGDQLLLTVNGGKDRFEGAGMFKRADDPGAVARIAHEIGLVFEVIHTLRLNAVTRT